MQTNTHKQTILHSNQGRNREKRKRKLNLENICMYACVCINMRTWGCPRGVMVKAMDCRIVVREFVLQSRYYVHVRRHAGHCWRSRDELIRDVLLWIPTHGRAKAGRPARTYIQQLCEDTGFCPEDLPRAMNDREEWRERVRDIRATSAIWWWWVK